MNTHVSSLSAVTRVTMIRKGNSRKEIEKEIRQYGDLLFCGYRSLIHYGISKENFHYIFCITLEIKYC